jgi:LuxR family transcriptional regulator, maltose regulon positive regulatory protein
LFAELLQYQLKRNYTSCLYDLHQRASLWYETHDMPTPSIEHALAAGDERRTVMLLEKYGWRLLTQEHSPMLLPWVQALPEALRNSRPRLNTGLVWGKILHGEYQQAFPYLAAAQTALDNLPPETDETRALQAEILALHAFMALAQNKASEALLLAEKGRALASGDNARLVGSTALALGVSYRIAGRFDEAITSLEEALYAAQTIDDHVTAMVSVVHLALICYPLGQLRRLVDKAEFVIEHTEIVAQVAPLMIGIVHAALGQVYYEWNQVEKAREMLLHGLRLAQLSNQPTSIIYVSIYLARLCQGEGDLVAAAHYLHEARKMLARGTPAWVYPDWLAQQACLLLAQGNLAEAEVLLGSTGITVASPVTYQTDILHLAWLRWMVASGHVQAFALAERIVQSAEAGGRNGILLQALVLGAKVGGGVIWLARARQLAAPEGYQRIFGDEAVDQVRVRGVGLVEPLTERELAVLRLLAAGLSYAEMATQLVVSVNTVRYHVKGVYGKLGVEKQTQAVERGRALGLI